MMWLVVLLLVLAAILTATAVWVHFGGLRWIRVGAVRAPSVAPVRQLRRPGRLGRRGPGARDHKQRELWSLEERIVAAALVEASGSVAAGEPLPNRFRVGMPDVDWRLLGSGGNVAALSRSVELTFVTQAARQRLALVPSSTRFTLERDASLVDGRISVRIEGAGDMRPDAEPAPGRPTRGPVGGEQVQASEAPLTRRAGSAAKVTLRGSGDAAGTVVVLDVGAGPVELGRALPELSQFDYVSQRHCTVSLVEGSGRHLAVEFEDLGSTNRTRVGTRWIGRGDRAVANSGSALQLGKDGPEFTVELH